MGVETVKLAENSEQVQEFIKYLLKDIRAMERMLSEGMFETGTIQIGAEQELCLVDKYAKPSPISIELLEALQDDNFTIELARFNLESREWMSYSCDLIRHFWKLVIPVSKCICTKTVRITHDSSTPNNFNLLING